MYLEWYNAYMQLINQPISSNDLGLASDERLKLVACVTIPYVYGLYTLPWTDKCQWDTSIIYTAG